MIGFTGVVDPYTKQGLQLQVKGGNAGDLSLGREMKREIAHN